MESIGYNYLIATGYYFSNAYVDQKKLEIAHNVSEGKYTIGLGQAALAVTGACEDVISIAYNAIDNLFDGLFEKGVDINEITKCLKHLEVGSESNHDKSKSIKSMIVGYLEEKTKKLGYNSNSINNYSGADSVNACIGGTVAVNNALNTLISSRINESNNKYNMYALVICTDIAIYYKKAEVPTSGMGAIALLLLNSPTKNPYINFQTGEKKKCKAVSFSNFLWQWKDVMDFYKPYLFSESPVVQGKLSIECYLNSVVDVFSLKNMKQITEDFRNETAAFLFHCPYSKITQKALSKMFTSINFTEDEIKEKFNLLTKKYQNISRNIGNSYTASLWFSILEFCIQDKIKKAYCFSYGSGLGASEFDISINYIDSESISLFPNLEDINEKLLKRKELTYNEMVFATQERKSLGRYRLINDPVFIEEFSQELKLDVQDNNKAFKPQNIEWFIKEDCWYINEIKPDGVRIYMKYSSQKEKKD